MVRIGNFLFRFRNGLFPLALLLVLLPGRDLFTEPLVAVALGVGVALVGQLVRCITIGFEYIIRGGRLGRVYAENLVTQGIYRLCRNPMYVGNLLIVAGLALASNLVTCLLVVIPLYAFVYVAIVAAEEAFLRTKFGAEYELYAAAVPRWLPRVSGLGAALRSGRFHWKRVLIKEFQTPFGWITMMLLVTLWHIASRHTMTLRHGTVRTLLVAYVVLAFAYV
jgi:protein-S-isoprenylcysteine O-methyltransferase Ste14